MKKITENVSREVYFHLRFINVLSIADFIVVIFQYFLTKLFIRTTVGAFVMSLKMFKTHMLTVKVTVYMFIFAKKFPLWLFYRP